MRNKAKLFGIYLPVFILFTLAVTVMRTVALFLQFDRATGYFTDKILISVANYTVAALALFLFTYIFTARRDIKLIPDFTSPATYVPTGLVATALIFTSISLFKKGVEVIEYIALLQSYNNPYYESQITTHRIIFAILIFCGALAILATVHFALTALVERHSSTRRANFGLCTVAFLSFYSIYLYFNTSLPLNAPNKTLSEMAHLFAAAFFLYEVRLSIGRERWREYISFGFIAASICAYSSIPSLIYYLATGAKVDDSVYETALIFAFFIFIVSRILLTGELIEDKKSRTVIAIIGAAEARDGEINPKTAAPEVIDLEGEALTDGEPAEADENQITIDDVVSAEQDEPEEAPDTVFSVDELSVEKADDRDTELTEIPKILDGTENAE